MKVKIRNLLIILGSIFILLIFLFFIYLGIIKGYGRSILRERSRQKAMVEENIRIDCLKNNNGGRFITIEGVEWWLDNTCEMIIPPNSL